MRLTGIFHVRLSARNSLWPGATSKRSSMVIPSNESALDAIDLQNKRMQYMQSMAGPNWKSRRLADGPGKRIYSDLTISIRDYAFSPRPPTPQTHWLLFC